MERHLNTLDEAFLSEANAFANTDSCADAYNQLGNTLLIWVFIFSTESWAGHDFSLRPTGRFAHNRTYIGTLARRYGFCLEFCRPAKIRKERGDWIMGELFMLRWAVA